MKKLVSISIALIAGFLFTNAFAQVETPKQLVLASTNDSTMKITQNMVVPANQTIYVYDANGKLIGSYTEGNTVIVPASKGKKKKELNCAKVPCPKSFRKGTTCWECH